MVSYGLGKMSPPPRPLMNCTPAPLLHAHLNSSAAQFSPLTCSCPPPQVLLLHGPAPHLIPHAGNPPPPKVLQLHRAPVLCGSEHCSAVHCSAVHCSAVHCSADPLTCSCPTSSGASAAWPCHASSACCSCASMWGVHLSERSPRTRCTTLPGGGRVNTSQ